MRQDKTVARILLIFSVTNVALAAPAVVRLRHLDVSEVAWEKRDNLDSDSDATGGSGSRLVLKSSGSESDASGDLSDSSPSASFHEGPAYPYSVHALGPVWRPVGSTSAPSHLHDDPGPLSRPLSPSGSLHQGSALGSPVGSHQDWEYVSSVGSLPQDWEHASSAASLPQGSEHASSAASFTQGSEHASPSHQDSVPNSPSDLPHQDLAPPESSLPNEFFNDAVKQKIKVAAGVVAIAGVSVGLVYGVQKLFKGTSSNSSGAKTIGRDLASTEGLPDHLQHRKKVTRRVLESLDSARAS